jgi:hypothetical protein
MNKKEILINELDSASDNILDEVIDFVQFLKYKNKVNSNVVTSRSINSYKGIAKDIWNKDAQEVINEMRADDR